MNAAPMASAVFVLALLTGTVQQVLPPTLEEYEVELGTTPAAVTFALDDEAFGNGTASCQVDLKRRPSGKRVLIIRVERTVEPDEIVFALLVFKVEVRGYDVAGKAVLKKDFNNFSFGDSQGGHWKRTLKKIPDSLARLKIIFFGNYE